MEEINEIKKTADRRRHLREPIIVFKVIEENSHQHLFGYAKDISRSGLFIASINPREPGERFRIAFQIPRTDIKVTCQCEVVWIRKYRQGSKQEPGYGISFLDLPEDTAAAIELWVSKETLSE